MRLVWSVVKVSAVFGQDKVVVGLVVWYLELKGKILPTCTVGCES